MWQVCRVIRPGISRVLVVSSMIYSADVLYQNMVICCNFLVYTCLYTQYNDSHFDLTTAISIADFM